MQIYYDILDKTSNTEIESIIQPLKSNTPKWWKELTPFQNGVKNIKHFIETFSWEAISNSQVFTTAKVCPGIKTYIDNSILLKFPCDVILETNESGNYTWKSSNNDINISHHNSSQAPEMADGHIILKFNPNCLIQTSKKSLISYGDPLLFNVPPYRASPGFITAYKEPIQPSFICFFPRVNQRYFFKYGDPMAIIQFSDNVNSISNKNMEKYVKKRRGGPKSFFLYHKK